MTDDVQTDSMPDEIDFSQGVRGKFFRPEAKMKLPVYLDPEVMRYLSQVATKKGLGVSDIANDLLRKEIAIIESVK